MASFGNVSLEHAKDDRASFVYFIKKACEDHDTPEFVELRRFLMDCFVEVDRDFDGFVGREDFDSLVEKAGSLPRKWGFAPTSTEMFATEEAKKTWRDQAFKEVNKSGTGTIPIDEWENWCLEHVALKAKLLNTAYAESKMKTNADDFKHWICAAARTRHCPEYKELYHFLRDCFMKADTSNVGLISAAEFDAMVELAGAAPRKFGFAPPSSETYTSDAARIAARTKMFNEIASKSIRGLKDKLPFNAWLEWAYAHICAKAMKLDPALSGKVPAVDDLSEASFGSATSRVKLSSVMRGITVAHASEDRATFVKFIKKATASKDTAEYAELRHFLMDCFVECDTDFDGLVKADTFDDMVERAGVLPRKWGFAPTTVEMFKSPEEIKSFREKTFKEINKSGTGAIPFDEWLDWSYSHVCAKGKLLSLDYAETRMATSADDFKLFIVNSAKSRHCPEFKELYHFLKGCFDKADRKAMGLIGAEEFDEMVELAGAAPRKFGFAPPSASTYASDAARISARTQMFKEIAAKNKRGMKDKLSFNAWLEWAYSHICEKAKKLDGSLSGVAPAVGDMKHASYGANR